MHTNGKVEKEAGLEETKNPNVKVVWDSKDQESQKSEGAAPANDDAVMEKAESQKAEGAEKDQS